MIEELTPNQSSIFLSPTNEQEVMSAIINLKNSSAADVDTLQIKPIKYAADLIAPPLTHVINLIISTGSFPMNMQIAKVILIFKGGDKNVFKNYRPISILPLFSKVAEKLILSRLTKFFTKHSILNSFQHGFRKNCSTETALVKQKEIIVPSFRCRSLTLGIYIDLSKAFDLISHSILIKKMQFYGVHGVALNLIASYLKNRKEYVSLNQFSSILKTINTVSLRAVF